MASGLTFFWPCGLPRVCEYSSQRFCCSNLFDTYLSRFGPCVCPCFFQQVHRRSDTLRLCAALLVVHGSNYASIPEANSATSRSRHLVRKARAVRNSLPEFLHFLPFGKTIKGAIQKILYMSAFSELFVSTRGTKGYPSLELVQHQDKIL